MRTLSTSHTRTEHAGAAAGRPFSPARRGRAQAAVELLAYAAFFFAVFVTAVAIFIQVQTQELTRSENAYAQEIAYGFADNIHTAFVAGPGFVESVSVPKDILGKRYWIMVSHSPNAADSETGTVYVEWLSDGKNMSFSAPTVTADYSYVGGAGGFVSNRTTANGKDFVEIDAAQGHMVNISNENGRIMIMKG